MSNPVKIRKTRSDKGKLRVPHGHGPNIKRIPSLTDYDIYNSLDDKKGLTYKEYCKIMFAFNLYTMMYLIYTGNILYLPYFLGTIQVIRRKPKKKRIDYGYLRKTGIKRYHTNAHSEGYSARMLWKKLRTRYRNPLLKHVITFRLNRAIKKEIIYAVKHKNTIYKYQEPKY